jgi:hypothetical protein
VFQLVCPTQFAAGHCIMNKLTLEMRTKATTDNEWYMARAAAIHLPCSMVGGRITTTRLTQEVKFESDLRPCVTMYRIILCVDSYGKQVAALITVCFCVFCRI